MNARRVALVLILVLGVGIPSTWAAVRMPPTTTTTTQPPTTPYIPAGMKLVSWSYPGPLPMRTTYGTLYATNPVVIEKVRAIINALPLQNLPPGTVCPMNYMIPELIQFSRTVSSPIAITVSFEFGGCAAATVTSGGARPRLLFTLGGPHLGSALQQIEQLIHPGPPPVF
jgi:hypothetical protein